MIGERGREGREGDRERDRGNRIRRWNRRMKRRMKIRRISGDRDGRIGHWVRGIRVMVR